MFRSNREQTRDLLLEYDVRIMPPHPRAAGLAVVYPWLNTNWVDQGWINIPPIPDTPEFKIIYPWETVGLSVLSDQLFMIASHTGYYGTREEFHRYFGSYLQTHKWEIVFEVYDNFPEEGEMDKLYFDLTEHILYYWNDRYIPVNSTLFADIILNNN